LLNINERNDRIDGVTDVIEARVVGGAVDRSRDRAQARDGLNGDDRALIPGEPKEQPVPLDRNGRYAPSATERNAW
jgi:hypothetical protein